MIFMYSASKTMSRTHITTYDASKLSTVYVVKSPVLGLQRAPENSELAPSVLVLSG